MMIVTILLYLHKEQIFYMTLTQISLFFHYKAKAVSVDNIKIALQMRPGSDINHGDSSLLGCSVLWGE